MSSYLSEADRRILEKDLPETKPKDPEPPEDHDDEDGGGGGGLHFHLDGLFAAIAVIASVYMITRALVLIFAPEAAWALLSHP
jgi:hypothetical protein